MEYHVYTPCPQLSGYVKCYWSLEGGPVSRERVFPDGCMEFVFHYGDAFTKINAAGEAAVQPVAFVHGQLRTFIELSATGKTGMFSVRLQPAGLRAFTNVDAQEITGFNVAAAEFWGKEGAVLEDQMLCAKHNNARVRLIEDFLLRRLGRAKDNLSRETYCVQAIAQAGGNINIDQLAVSVNWGRRHMERRLTACVGLNPRRYFAENPAMVRFFNL